MTVKGYQSSKVFTGIFINKDNSFKTIHCRIRLYRDPLSSHHQYAKDKYGVLFNRFFLWEILSFFMSNCTSWTSASLDPHARDFRLFCNLIISVVMLTCVWFVAAICDCDFSSPPQITCCCNFHGLLSYRSRSSDINLSFHFVYMIIFGINILFLIIFLFYKNCQSI